MSHRFLASQGRQNRRGGWIPQGDRNPVQASDEKQVKRRLGEHQGKHHHGPQPHRHDVGGSHSDAVDDGTHHGFQQDRDGGVRRQQNPDVLNRHAEAMRIQRQGETNHPESQARQETFRYHHTQGASAAVPVPHRVPGRPDASTGVPGGQGHGHSDDQKDPQDQPRPVARARPFPVSIHQDRSRRRCHGDGDDHRPTDPARPTTPPAELGMHDPTGHEPRATRSMVAAITGAGSGHPLYPGK